MPLIMNISLRRIDITLPGRKEYRILFSWEVQFFNFAIQGPFGNSKFLGRKLSFSLMFFKRFTYQV